MIPFVSIAAMAVCGMLCTAVSAALYQKSVIPLIAVYPIIAVLTAAAVFCSVRSYRRIRETSGEESAA